MKECGAILRRSSAAKRMRLHRERKRDRMRYIGIELRATEIDALVRKGLLRPETRNDAAAIIKGLYTFLERTLDPVS